MTESPFTIKIENQIAIIELAEAVVDADRLVNLSFGLSDACGQVRADAGIKVLVLTDKAENGFSMGEAIIEQVAQQPEAVRRQIRMLVESLAALDQPVIAAIKGDAVGFGLELALACDIRIATGGSQFGLPHVKKGLLPWCGGSQRLPRIAGQAKALEMILTGALIDARTASQTGLVCKVVPEADLMTETMNMARTLAEKGTLAMGYIKEAVNKGLDLSMDQGLRLEADLYYLLHTTADRTEGIKAFQERRSPKFSGK